MLHQNLLDVILVFDEVVFLVVPEKGLILLVKSDHGGILSSSV